MRPVVVMLGLAACTPTSRPAPTPAVTPPAPAVVADEPAAPVSPPEPQVVEPADLGARLDTLATWLEGQPGVERVAAWKTGERYVWVRDAAGSTWCWQDRHCWTDPGRPDLISVLSDPDGGWRPDALRLAWGPDNGKVAVWDLDFAAGQRRVAGEVVARTREPLPFWWVPEQSELSVPGDRVSMPATAPPYYYSLAFKIGGRPGATTASPKIAAPTWLPLLADLEIWPYRSSTGLAAFAVTAKADVESPIGTCARLDRWRCGVLDRPARQVELRAPVRGELVGDAIAVEIAEVDELVQDGEYGDYELGEFLARAELHVLAVDARSGRLASVGARTLGGAVGTVADLGMYRSEVDLGYRAVRRAYRRWSVADRCLRVEALRGEDVMLDREFEPLWDLLVKQWRARTGTRLLKPRKPVDVDAAAARVVVARASVLPPDPHDSEPGRDLAGAWQVAGGRLVRATCAP